jgi:hypothetical protein
MAGKFKQMHHVQHKEPRLPVGLAGVVSSSSDDYQLDLAFHLVGRVA